MARPGDLRSFPPAGVAWAASPGGLGGAEYGALPTFLQVGMRRLGGSSRRRAQSPFVRRNKERHYVFLHGGDAHRGVWVLPGPGVVVPGVGERGGGAPLGKNGTFALIKTGSGMGMVLCLILSRIPGFRGFRGLPLHVL